LRRTLPETRQVASESQSEASPDQGAVFVQRTGVHSEGVRQVKRFDVEIDRRDDYVVVRPVGELDLSAGQAIEEALGPLENEFSEVVIDLRAVEVLDSTGLRVILAADARSRSDGFNLRIIKGSHQVRRLLSLTGMNTRLPLIDASELGDAARS
jgi:anti-sigma B factor antagonist